MATATKTPEGVKAFTEMSNNVSQNPQAAAAFTQTMASATKTPEGVKSVSEIVRNASRDPAASTVFMQTMARAAETPDGARAVTEICQNLSRDPQASANLMGAALEALKTPEGKRAYEQLSATASKDPALAAALLQTRASEAGTSEGSATLAREMSFLSESPKLQASFVESLGRAVERQAGQEAFAQLCIRSAESQPARESLMEMLNRAQKSPEAKESLYNLYGKVSQDSNLSSSMMALMSRVPGSEKGRTEMIAFLGSVRSDAKIRNSFLGMINSTLEHPKGAGTFSSFSNGMRSSQDAREDFVRTLTQMSAGGTAKEGLKTTLTKVFARESTRDAIFDIFNDSLLGSKGKTYFKHFTGNLEKDPELKSLFMDNFTKACSTARGQSRFLDMMKAFDMEPALIRQSEKMARQSINTGLSIPPIAAKMSSEGPLPLARAAAVNESPDAALRSKLMSVKEAAAADPRIVADRAISSGMAVRMRRDVFGKRSKGSDEVEEVSFDPEKISSNDPYEVFADSNIRFTRECPHCGNKIYKRMDYCPDCMDEGREVVMRTRVTFKNRGQSFMAQEDWIEFSSTAVKVLIKEQQEQLALFREFTSKIIPKYREILAVVKMYQ
jgi:hypothetical protein